MKKDDNKTTLIDLQDDDSQIEEKKTIQVASQPEFFKVPRRFGNIPVDDVPTGYDKNEQYRKLYPFVSLPFQPVERVSFGHPELEPNRLFFGDNLHVMRLLPPESIDLIYLDPPFFSGRNYNVIFGDANEVRSFTDVWEGGMPGYLTWLNARLLEMKRLLKPTGSVFIHLDWHACHYVKVETDKIFGYENFQNEIIWHYSGWNKQLKDHVERRHDSILFYSKSKNPYFKYPTRPWASKEEYVKKRKQKVRIDSAGKEYVLSDAGDGQRVNRYLEDAMSYGIPIDDVWDMDKINNSDKIERIGYPTQKPELLLQQIIEMASKPGDVVADFFVGGGTTAVAAQRLGRRWIACDQSKIAVAVTLDRVLKVVQQQEGEGTQQVLGEVPDISLEHWGVYEIPSLTKLSEEQFRHFIIHAYNGRIATAGDLVHGYKEGIPLFVGPASQEKPITKEEVLKFGETILRKKGKKHGVMLAWAFAPSARAAMERLAAQQSVALDFVKLDLVPVESPQFKLHITTKNPEYENLLSFVMPPEVRLEVKRLAPHTYEFDISESISINPGGKIMNVQWDFEHKKRFVSTRGYSFIRDPKNNPELIARYEFPHSGKYKVACKVQDDQGGERMKVVDLEVS